MTASPRPSLVGEDELALLSIDQKLALVAEARNTFDQKFARRLWISFGLPSPLMRRPESRSRLGEDLIIFERFLTSRCRRDPASEVAAAALYRAYCEWAEGERVRPVTLSMFGRLVTACGIEKFQRSSIFYLGIGLI